MKVHGSRREHSHTILIVDDHDDTRETLSMVIEAAGYPVATAANGLEALFYLRNNPLPCIILLDLTMPVMNGWEFREEQRKDPHLERIPVVVVSGTDYDRNSVQLDAIEYFNKPVDINALTNTVIEYC